MESDAYLYELQDRLEQQQGQDVQSDEEGTILVDFPIQELKLEAPFVEGIGVVLQAEKQLEVGQRVVVRATGATGTVKQADSRGLVEVIPTGAERSLLFSAQELRVASASETRKTRLSKRAYLTTELDETEEDQERTAFENDCLTATNRRYHHSISEAIEDFSGRLNLVASESPQTRSEMKKFASTIREEEATREKTDSATEIEEDFLRALEA